MDWCDEEGNEGMDLIVIRNLSKLIPEVIPYIPVAPSHQLSSSI